MKLKSIVSSLFFISITFSIFSQVDGIDKQINKDNLVIDTVEVINFNQIEVMISRLLLMNVESLNEEIKRKIDSVNFNNEDIKDLAPFFRVQLDSCGFVKKCEYRNKDTTTLLKKEVTDVLENIFSHSDWRIPSCVKIGNKNFEFFDLFFVLYYDYELNKFEFFLKDSILEEEYRVVFKLDNSYLYFDGFHYKCP